jgi:hypothetical protein
MPSPDRATVLAQAAAGSSFIPIWRTWPADLETPLTTWLKVGAGSEHGVLLESEEPLPAFIEAFRRMYPPLGEPVQVARRRMRESRTPSAPRPIS